MTGIQASRAVEEYTVQFAGLGGRHAPGSNPVVRTAAGRRVSLRKGATLIVRSVTVEPDGAFLVQVVSQDDLTAIFHRLLAD